MKNGNGHKITIPFQKWSRRKVEDVFGLKFEKQASFLKDWLSTDGTPPAHILPILEELGGMLDENVDGWNEIELYGRFLAPFLWSVHFYNLEKRIQEFAGRPFILPDERYEVKGNADWFVARGRDEPEAPFFFIHEYKRFKQGDSDPRGQLLIEMLAAQKINADGFPIYGAWVAGSAWNFILLNGNVYSESYPYEARNPEKLTEIWLILNKTKYLIYDHVDKIIAAEKEANAQSPVI